MYYDSLRKKVHDTAEARRSMSAPRVPIEQCIAPAYMELHKDVAEGGHVIYNLPGGRGSCKSSFVSLEMVDGIMHDSEANGIVFRRYAATMRESTYAQVAWAIEELGASSLWRGSVSPMQYTYLPTGQVITFRGLDDAAKVKSIKPRRGIYRYVWFEEYSELLGVNQVRSALQSVMRGGGDFRVFNSFNPPLSVNNWANRAVLEPDDRAVTFRTTYLDVPRTWLGEDFIAEAERLKVVNPQAYRHEYMGEATGSGGEVFPNIETREITEDEEAQLEYVYSGLDFGFASDPAAFVRLAYDRKKQAVYFLGEIVAKHKSNAELADMIRAKGYDKEPGSAYVSPMLSMGGYRPPTSKPDPAEAVITCDSAEPKSIADLRGLGLKVRACTKYPGCVQYRVKWLQTKRLVIDPKRTPYALKEFTGYEYETTKDGEFTSDLPDRDNHTIDATAYALDRVINDKRNSA